MKLGVVGDKQSVKGFAALGIDTFPVTNPDEVSRTIHKLAKEDYAVLFVTEQAVSMAEEAVNTYATSPFPAIIPIPGNRGTLGIGMSRISENVEKAVGTNIFFD